MSEYDVQAVRERFPILSREVYGRSLVYLDNGASAQKPLSVIEAVDRTYRHEYANVHRGLHYLSNHATEAYEAVRSKIARFLGADREEEIVYTRSTTEAINLVASSWLEPRIREGDEIVLSVLEHHANIVPWHFLRERKGAVLKWVDIEDDGSLDPGRCRNGPRRADAIRGGEPHVQCARNPDRYCVDCGVDASPRDFRSLWTAARRPSTFLLTSWTLAATSIA